MPIKKTMALPAAHRFKRTKEFKSAFRSQMSLKEGRLAMKAKKSSGKESRFGIVVSKAVSKKATDRNRMRRLLGEAAAANKAKLASPHDIVFVALPGLSLESLEEAKEAVEKLFHKARPSKQ